MNIYNHYNRDLIILELEENELTLVTYLLEKNAQNLKGKMENPLSLRMFKEIDAFHDGAPKKQAYDIEVFEETLLDPSTTTHLSKILWEDDEEGLM